MIEAVLEVIDPRLVPGLRAELEGRRAEAPPRRLVLAGHRAAGKSRLLPLIAAALGRRAIDLDRELERSSGRALARWVVEDEPGFRRAERQTFAALDPHAVIAVGGGFLSHHPDLLRDRTVVLVPISFETYRARLLADRSRPRLRPELSLEEELATVFGEREVAHARVPTVPLAALLASLGHGR